MFQMASSTIATSKHEKQFPHSVMVCEGNIYHLINPIETNGEHKFVQVYTIDGQEQRLATRIRNFRDHCQTAYKGRSANERLLEGIVKEIQQVMHEHNDHVTSVVAMHETLKNPALGGRDVVKHVFEQKVECVEEDPKTGQRDSGTAGQRDSGTAGQRDSGTAGQRDSGTAGQRDSGTAGQRDSGTAGQRDRNVYNRNVYNKPRTTSEVMRVVDDRAPPEHQLVLLAKNRGGVPSTCACSGRRRKPTEADGAVWIKNVVYKEVLIEDT